MRSTLMRHRLLRAGRVPRLARGLWGEAEKGSADLTVALDVGVPPPAFLSTMETKVCSARARIPLQRAPSRVRRAQVTTLENGLKVASCDLPLPCTTVGLYVGAGSAQEQVGGTAHVLQHMAFASSEGFSQLKASVMTEQMGIAASIAGRENMVYQIDTLKDLVPEAVELLGSSVFAPKFHSWEIDAAVAIAKKDLEERKNNHQLLLQEYSHAAAFGGRSPLGRSLTGPAWQLDHVSSDVLSQFVTEQYTPERSVLVAAGYDHDKLVLHAQRLLGHLAPGTPNPPVASEYVGGEYRESADDPLSHFALAFKGASWKDDSLIPLCVLNTMMGGGTSFSAGGPGKGMYTRLYQNILNRFAFCHAASVYNAVYDHEGIFGVYCAAPAEYMGHLVTVICDEMAKMASGVSATELGRAKNQLTSSLLMNLESRPILFEDIGRQVLTYGHRIPPEELMERISAVTADDITSVAKQLLGSRPSVVVYGDATSVPRYDQIAARFARG